MTKYVCTTLMAAGLLTMTAVAQDEDTDLDIFSLDDSSAESSSADSSDAASDDSADASDSVDISLGDEEDSNLDDSSSEESSDSSLDDSSADDSGDLSLDSDSSSDESDSDLSDISSDTASDDSDIEEATPVSEAGGINTATTTGSDSKVIANPDKTSWHFISLGDKYVLIKSNLVGHVTPLSTVVIYIGWSADRNSSWGKGETLAKHSRTITSFYVPIRVSGVSLSGGNINLHGSDDAGAKTVKAPYRELDNTLEIKKPEL